MLLWAKRSAVIKRLRQQRLNGSIMDGRERRLVIKGILEQVRVACEFIAEVARDVGFDDDGVYHCVLSVEEICTNIVEHGYEFKGDDKVIEIVCRPQPDGLLITISDEAPAFNPLERDDPDPNVPLWERQGGGWGIYFVRQYMNYVGYRYDNQRNHLILQKHFT